MVRISFDAREPKRRRNLAEEGKTAFFQILVNQPATERQTDCRAGTVVNIYQASASVLNISRRVPHFHIVLGSASPSANRAPSRSAGWLSTRAGFLLRWDYGARAEPISAAHIHRPNNNLTRSLGDRPEQMQSGCRRSPVFWKATSGKPRSTDSFQRLSFTTSKASTGNYCRQNLQTKKMPVENGKNM